MILNTGDVPNIYESDEKAEITEQVKKCDTTVIFQWDLEHKHLGYFRTGENDYKPGEKNYILSFSTWYLTLLVEAFIS